MRVAQEMLKKVLKEEHHQPSTPPSRHRLGYGSVSGCTAACGLSKSLGLSLAAQVWRYTMESLGLGPERSSDVRTCYNLRRRYIQITCQTESAVYACILWLVLMYSVQEESGRGKEPRMNCVTAST